MPLLDFGKRFSTPLSQPAVKFISKLLRVISFVACWALCWSGFAALSHAQTTHAGGKASTRTGVSGAAHIDHSTRWTFQARSYVTVNSPVVRLRDVISPVDRQMPAWRRLAQSPIGLVPVGSQIMTIDRDRLTTIILAAEATPTSIDWLGPQKIKVSYAKPPLETSRPIDPSQPHPSAVRQASYRKPTGDQTPPVDPVQTPRLREPPLTATQLRQIKHRIDLAIKQFQPEIQETYSIEITDDQDQIRPLKDIVRVTDLKSLGTIAPGPCRFAIRARQLGGPIQATLTIHLTPHPVVVVAKGTLGRGQLIAPADVELRHVPPKQLKPDSVTDLASLVGQETKSLLRSGQPIAKSDVGSPVLIHRGDLIEVVVIGGGVRVSTNAKAASSGSKGELIELETTDRRKRFLGRVAAIGVAEISTRAPTVR